MTMEQDGLDRIRRQDEELIGESLTNKEVQFLTFIFLHITCAFELTKHGHLVSIEQMRYDIRELLKAPLVCQFWANSRLFYNADFVKFIDSCRATLPSG
jgi:hypothetical protein